MPSPASPPLSLEGAGQDNHADSHLIVLKIPRRLDHVRPFCVRVDGVGGAPAQDGLRDALGDVVGLGNQPRRIIGKR